MADTLPVFLPFDTGMMMFPIPVRESNFIETFRLLALTGVIAT
jgi:hypothetical protein